MTDRRPPAAAGAPHLRRGRLAEDAAEAYLQEQGLEPVDRNFRCRLGEIDLIMRHGPTLVFVEVRFRSSDRYGSALESIDHRKQSRLIRAAGIYLSSRRLDTPARFDVVAVSQNHGNWQITWIRDAFRP